MIGKFLLLVLIIIFAIIFIYLFALLTKNLIKEEINEYQVIDFKDNGDEMNYCLPGCIRGACKKTNDNNSCKFDFQCEYCQDNKTNMFYVDNTNDIEILPLYQEESLNIDQQNKLNDLIDDNNKYILDLNKKIKIINS
jgi:hypothetical protein